MPDQPVKPLLLLLGIILTFHFAHGLRAGAQPDPAAGWPHAALLKSLPAEVRDPAGVVYRLTSTPALKGRAEVLYFLHTFQPAQALTDWVEKNRLAKRAGDRPLDPPTLFRYVLRYQKSAPVTVNVRWDEAVNTWLRSGEFAPPAFATTAWQQTVGTDWVQDIFPRRGQHVALYGFRFENPKPDEEITGVEIIPSKEWGTPLLLAVSAGKREYPGQTRYVAPGGNDDGTGTFANPWATVYKAAATLQAGDTVYIRAGRYKLRQDWKDVIVVQNSGTDGRPVTFSSYPGETAVIDGDGHHCAMNEHVPYATFDRDRGLFNIFAKSYVAVRGLWFESSRKSGLGVYESRDILLDHNFVFGTAHCAMNTAANTDLRIIGNTLGKNCSIFYLFNPDTQEWTPWKPGSGKAKFPGREGIDNHRNEYEEIAFNEIYWCNKEAIADPGRHIKIHHNYIHDLPHTPETYWPCGIYLDAYGPIMDDIDVHDNVIHNAAGGICIGSEGGTTARDIRVHHNLVFDNTWEGIGIGAAGSDGLRENIVIENNTIVHCGDTAWEKGPTGGLNIGTTNVRNITVRYNIFSDNRDYQVSVSSRIDRIGQAVSIVDNLYDPVFLPTERVLPRIMNYNPVASDRLVFGNPRFMDAAAHDYRLQKNSPAIDVIETATDPDGTAADLGAFAFVQEMPALPEAGKGYVLRLDSGSDTDYTDKQGRIWKTDKGLLRKWDWGCVRRAPRPIAGTDDPELYLTEWFGPPRFELNVPPGKYRLRLHFSETLEKAAGRRVFSVLVNRLPFAEHLDVFKTAGGANVAHVEDKEIAAPRGKVVIEFTKETGAPIINAIELIQETK